MSYEYFEEARRIKIMLRELGILKKLEEIEKRIEEIEKALDDLGERVFWLECTAEEGEYERE